MRERCDVEPVATLAVLELCEAAAEPLEGWADHAHARLALLTVETVDADFSLTFRVGAEDEAVALISLNHVRQLCREDIIAAILTLFLAGNRVDVLDGQVPVELL